VKTLLSVLLLLPVAAVHAATCEENFQKKGNPFVGTTYSASVSVPGLDVASALGQMRSIATGKGMDVLSEDADGGSMLIEDPETIAHKPLPMIVTAGSEGGVGEVKLVLKLNKGAMGPADGIKAEMCGMLAQIKPGAAGAKAAQAGKAAPKPTVISAYMLSAQLTRQADDNLAAIQSRYAGKVFQVSGRVTGVIQEGKGYNLGFGSADPNSVQSVAITCRLAKNQTANALSLHVGDKVTATGTFDEFLDIRRLFLLKECRLD
jgi:tRNA_anti-like